MVPAAISRRSLARHAYTHAGHRLHRPGRQKCVPRETPIGCTGHAARNVSSERHPINGTGQAARNVSPENDPSAIQATRNVSPESDPVGYAGQAARNVSPERDPIGCTSQAVSNMSPERDPPARPTEMCPPRGTLYRLRRPGRQKCVPRERPSIGCAGQAAKKVDSESIPNDIQSLSLSVSLPAGTELQPAALGKSL